MKREDNNYCEYCDVCAGRMTAEDGGVAFAAIQMMTWATGTLHDQVTDPAETRRIINRVLDDVLAGNDYRHPDVSAFTMAPRFQPVAGTVTA
jgi:hypothetical protein